MEEAHIDSPPGGGETFKLEAEVISMPDLPESSWSGAISDIVEKNAAAKLVIDEILGHTSCSEEGHVGEEGHAGRGVPSCDISIIQEPTSAEETEDCPKVASSARSTTASEPVPNHVGSKIPTRIRSLLLLASALIIATILTAITIAFTSTSFSINLLYKSPFLPYDPQNAIVLLQLLATLSLMAIREAFLISSEVLRWTLASQGINFLTFIVMSEATGFWGVI